MQQAFEQRVLENKEVQAPREAAKVFDQVLGAHQETGNQGPLQEVEGKARSHRCRKIVLSEDSLKW
jgi:hypothetical protein